MIQEPTQADLNGEDTVGDWGCQVWMPCLIELASLGCSDLPWFEYCLSEWTINWKKSCCNGQSFQATKI